MQFMPVGLITHSLVPPAEVVHNHITCKTQPGKLRVRCSNAALGGQGVVVRTGGGGGAGGGAGGGGSVGPSGMPIAASNMNPFMSGVDSFSGSTETSDTSLGGALEASASPKLETFLYTLLTLVEVLLISPVRTEVSCPINAGFNL